jgi:Zn finger protein HypA/HybF involved in hydrogenase expression
MAKIKVTLYKFVCERCEHEWIPREAEVEPRVCPKCKSPYWNTPRRAVKSKK